MLDMAILLIGTRNGHKVQEIQWILGNGFSYRTLADYSKIPGVVEDADTFAGNARKKAAEMTDWVRNHLKSGIDFVLADDSGLEVDALGGAPGVYSARFANMDRPQEGNSSDTANNVKLLSLLAVVPGPKRTARFRCALALMEVHGDKREWAVEGVCEGRIDFAPRGSAGFGYDPLFVPAGHDCSFAQLGDSVKNEISHRSVALRKLRAEFNDLREVRMKLSR